MTYRITGLSPKPFARLIGQDNDLFTDKLPPVFENRPIAFRAFDTAYKCFAAKVERDK